MSLKILYLPSWYPSRKHSSSGIFIKRHAEAAALYNDVAVLFVTSDEGLKNKYETEIKKERNVFTVIVYYKKVTSLAPIISNAIKLKRLLSAYFKGYAEVLKQCGSPDLIHLNVIFPAGIFALCLKWKRKIPFIISEHWSGYLPEDGNYKGILLKLITKACVKYAKAIIVISEKMKRAMLNHGLKNKFYKVPNVVDIELFKPVPLNLSVVKKRMLHVSTLNDREKNITGILNTIEKVSRKRDDFILEIVGDFNNRKEYFEKKSMEMGISPELINFTGFLDPKDITQRMQASAFLIMFSNYEGLPCVILEAFSCGLPVIATETGGIPEILNEERGILVPVKDEDAFGNAINLMLDNYQTYNKEKIQAYAKENFSYEIIGSKLTSIYSESIKADV